MVLGLVTEISTRSEAQSALDRKLGPINQGLRQPESIVSFRDFAEGQWTNLDLPNFKLSTQRGYKMVLRRHLMPFWADWRLCDISKMRVQLFIAEKFRQGLAWQTVRNAWIVQSSILDSAVEYGYLAVNPARGVKFPQPKLPKAPVVLTGDCFSKLLAQLQEPYKTMVALTTLTGLRIGELLALRWRAVDLTNLTIRVSESVFQGQFQRPKSERSVRTIPIGPITQWLLECHLKRSKRTHPDDLLFPSKTGGPFRECNLIGRVLRPAAEAAGINRVTWHQLRHVHASLLHDLGVPAKVAQQQLGHATVETTLKLYTHAIPETHRRAVEGLERVLFPNVPKSVDEAKQGGLVI